MDLYADERADLPPDHPAAGRAGHRWPARCWRSRCPSTTSSSRTSTRARSNTFPKFVYVSSLRGIPAQANVIGSAMFFLALSRCSSGQARQRPPEDAVGRATCRRAGRGLRGRPRRRTARAVLAGRARARPVPGARRRTTADLAVVGGGYTGLWTALLAKERDPGRDVVLLEGRDRRLGGLRAQRRLLLGQPHPRPGQRPGPVPGRDGRPWSGSAGRTSTASRRPSPTTASTAPSSAPASSTVATAPWQVDELRELPELAARVGSDGWSGSTRDAGPRARWTRRPTSAACSTATAPRWSTRPGWPGGCATRACGSASGSTRTPRSQALDGDGAGVALRDAVRPR